MPLLVLIFLLSASGAGYNPAFPVAAHAQNCPANPNGLGTSRILVLAPTDYMRLGTMRDPETLPLADKEVVLTFDNGPLPPYSNKILDILTSECVKATFFIIGRMARQFPDVVRREYATRYSIGAHSQNHPLRFQKLSRDLATRRIWRRSFAFPAFTALMKLTMS
jgi:peptidoglycan/xylan/chitin deacetylase (PgdA/CDA1 family)